MHEETRQSHRGKTRVKGKQDKIKSGKKHVKRKQDKNKSNRKCMKKKRKPKNEK